LLRINGLRNHKSSDCLVFSLPVPFLPFKCLALSSAYFPAVFNSIQRSLKLRVSFSVSFFSVLSFVIGPTF